MRPFKILNVPNVFLLMALCFLLVPSFMYWMYPHPKNIRLEKGELLKTHNERISNIENEIKTAIGHHQGGTIVFGGAEPWAQAKRDELALRDKLNLENINYDKAIRELERFPLTDALVIFSISLTMIGIYFQIKK